MASRDYHKWYLSLVSIAVVIELIALRRDDKGDTMSEWVWSKISQWPLRTAVGALLVWLLYHFVWSGPRPLSRWDLVSVLVGAAIGFASFRWGWR